MTTFEYDFHKHHNLSLSKETYLKRGLCGLTNQGNTCFLNSILQCLNHTLKLTDYFLSGNYKQDDPECLNSKKQEYYLVLSYINLLINMWETNQIIRPKSFFENLSKFIRKYFSRQQQDSHECLLFILDILHRGLSYEIEVDIKGEVQNRSDELMKRSLESWRGFYQNGYSFIIETFGGMFYNQIKCNNCTFSEDVFDPFNCISLEIPINGSSTLNGCLQHFCNHNELIDSWKCEKCEQIGCSKNTTFWSIPNYIIFHLKRFTNNNTKINTHIDFPIENLDLTSYLSSDKNDPNNYIYNCYAINYHTGDSDGGHYWSACKNLNGQWYKFNDSNVSKVTDTEMSTLSQNAYIMFFSRKMITTPLAI